MQQPRDALGRFSHSHTAPDDGQVSADPRKNLDQFRHALAELDARLTALEVSEPVLIRATGGFAMLVHGLRDDGYTVDIDTITDTYPPQVRAAINDVAADLHLEQDWVNNMAAGHDAQDTLEILDAVFIAQDYGYENIDLRVADVPTLTRAKAIAVDVDAMSGRSRDWTDLLQLLEHQNITTYRQFCAHYPTIRSWEYPETHRSLESWFATGKRGEPEVDDFDFDEWDLDELLAA